MKEIFFSVDIEADGAIPIQNSMLSFGIAAFNEEGEMISTFSRNLELLDGALPDPETMEWWLKFPEAYANCRKDLVKPKQAMEDCNRWVNSLCDEHKSRAVMVAYPAGFDFTFMYVYFMKFLEYSPFSFACLDTKTYASAVLGIPFRDATKKNFPKRWRVKRRHSHIALDDAIGQGEQFIKIYKENIARINEAAREETAA